VGGGGCDKTHVEKRARNCKPRPTALKGPKGRRGGNKKTKDTPHLVLSRCIDVFLCVLTAAFEPEVWLLGLSHVLCHQKRRRRLKRRLN